MRYKKIKNKLIKHLKFQKNKYYNELFSKNNQSDNWKVINKLINKKYNNFLFQIYLFTMVLKYIMKKINVNILITIFLILVKIL